LLRFLLVIDIINPKIDARLIVAYRFDCDRSDILVDQTEQLSSYPAALVPVTELVCPASRLKAHLGWPDSSWAILPYAGL
jgi:hypothetical protein